MKLSRNGWVALGSVAAFAAFWVDENTTKGLGLRAVNPLTYLRIWQDKMKESPPKAATIEVPLPTFQTVGNEAGFVR